MPRARFIQSTTNPYSIGGRAHNRSTFPLPQDQMWEILCYQLHFTAHAFNMRIHNFVMMRNHFHLIASAPEQTLSAAMQHFMRESCRTVNNITGNINQFWGSRHFRSEMTDPQHYVNAYKYFYLNPVTAKIVTRVEDYPYSTLSGLLGRTRLLVPVHDDIVMADPEQTLRWLNRPVSEENLMIMKTALKHQKFELAKLDSRPHPLNFEML
jgi:putative transposase